MIAAMAFMTSRNNFSMSAMSRARWSGHACLVADRRQQLQLRLVELVRAVAVDIQDAEDRVGRPHRRAHHRPDALPDDALAGAVALVGERIVGEGRDAVLENVAHDGARQHHVAATSVAPVRVRTATTVTRFSVADVVDGRMRMAARSPLVTSRMADRIESNSASTPVARDRTSDTRCSVER